MNRLFSLLTYFGIGLLCYVVFEGTTHFDPNDLMLYVWLLVWPLFLLVKFIKWVLIIVGVVVAVSLLIGGIIIWHDRRD